MPSEPSNTQDFGSESEETQEPVVASAKRGRKPKEKEPEVVKTSFRVCCTTKVTGTLFDTKRNVRIPPAGHGDIQIAGPIAEGSWMDAQIKAGLIQIVD